MEKEKTTKDEKDTAGTGSTSTDLLCGFSLSIARELRDKHNASVAEIRWVLNVCDLMPELRRITNGW